MIHVGVGHSHDLSTAEAAEQATRLAMGTPVSLKPTSPSYLQPLTIKRSMNSCIKRFMPTPVVRNSSGVPE